MRCLALILLIAGVFVAREPCAAETGWTPPPKDLCEGIPLSVPETGKIEIETRRFERNPVFVERIWRHSFNTEKLSNVRTGDFDCDGKADIAVYDPARRILEIGISDGAGNFLRTEAGVLPAGVEWSEATVARLQEKSCAQLVLPDHAEGAMVLSQLCGDHRFRWQKLQRSESGSDFRKLRFVNSSEEGGRYFLGWSKEGPYLWGTFDLRRGISEEFEKGRLAPTVAIAGAAKMFSRPPVLVVNISPYVSYFLDEQSRLRTFAHFPNQFAWGDPVLADINGDGVSDLVIVGLSIQGSWIALSYGDFRIEFPNVSLSRLLKNRRIGATGDFDGDGVDDLLIVENGELIVLSAEAGHALPHRPVEVNGQKYFSGKDGKISIPAQAGMRFEIRATEKNFAINPRVVRIADRDFRRPQILLLDDEHQNEHGALAPPPEKESTGPYLCTGQNLGGPPDSPEGRANACPDHYAFLEADDTDPMMLGACCRLPSDDILTGKSEWKSGACSEDSIITAIRYEGALEIQCSQINSAGYQLSAPSKGLLYGEGGAVSFKLEQIDQSRIPLAIRSGIGLSGRGGNGCIGKPWGALLTEIHGGRCDKMSFRILLRKRQDGATEPVKMFPDCSSLPDVYDPSRGCLP